MNLKDFLAKRDDKNREIYWAVVLEDSWVSAGLWEIVGEQAEVISTSPSIAWNSEEDLIPSTDAALSTTIQSVSEEVPEPSKTVFGLPSSWIEKGEIKAEHLENIKKICSKLSLVPSGFVVLSEAIAHLIKAEEGAPANAAIMYIGKENLELSVFRLGILAGSTTVSRSVSLIDDIVEGLSRFSTGDPLPTRFILYNSKEGELEAERQELLRGDWLNLPKLKFLHTPKVETINPEKKVLATALAGASEMGGALGVKISDAKEKEIPAKLEDTKAIPTDNVSPDQMGFVVGGDIKDKENVANIQNPNIENIQVPQEAQQHKEQQAGQLNTNKNLFLGTKEKLGGVGNMVTRMGQRIKLPKLGGKKALPLAAGALVIVLILFLVFWWFYPKAEITVYVAPQKLNENVEVSTSAGASSDFSNNTIASEALEVEVNGSNSKSTTGLKTIGDKAKGSVTIQNGTSEDIDLSSGTQLVASNDLVFVTTNDVSVVAALSPSEPGITSVDVEAGDIGASYNLAKDESFRVSDYLKSEVDAKANADFSGGSSREISAVAQEDLDGLEAGLTDELTQDAKDKLTESMGEDNYLIDESIKTEIVSSNFSHKVGDESGDVSLELSILATGLVIKNEDLFNFSKEVLKDKVPTGYVLREDQIELEFELDEETEDSTFIFDTSITANLLPEIKTDDIKKRVVGKTPESAEKMLTAIPGFVKVEFKLMPKLPGWFGTLPRVAGNIDLQISAQK